MLRKIISDQQGKIKELQKKGLTQSQSVENLEKSDGELCVKRSPAIPVFSKQYRSVYTGLSQSCRVPQDYFRSYSQFK